jgi:Tfp pilus assembly protein PilX
MRPLRLIVARLHDQQGIALPMALLTLLILSTLAIAFAVLATSEPLIATNQKMVAQARAVAESGLERAIWALNNPANANGLAAPLPTPVPAPTTAAPGSQSRSTGCKSAWPS